MRDYQKKIVPRMRKKRKQWVGLAVKGGYLAYVNGKQAPLCLLPPSPHGHAHANAHANAHAT